MEIDPNKEEGARGSFLDLWRQLSGGRGGRLDKKASVSVWVVFRGVILVHLWIAIWFLSRVRERRRSKWSCGGFVTAGWCYMVYVVVWLFVSWKRPRRISRRRLCRGRTCASARARGWRRRWRRTGGKLGFGRICHRPAVPKRLWKCGAIELTICTQKQLFTSMSVTPTHTRAITGYELDQRRCYSFPSLSFLILWPLLLCKLSWTPCFQKLCHEEASRWIISPPVPAGWQRHSLSPCIPFENRAFPFAAVSFWRVLLPFVCILYMFTLYLALPKRETLLNVLSLLFWTGSSSFVSSGGGGTVMLQMGSFICSLLEPD